MSIIAFDMVNSSNQNLVSFSNGAPLFSSGGDGFGFYQRGLTPSIPFSLLDDTLSVFPGDTLGIVGEGDLDEFFGVVDTENGDNIGPVSAEWEFDIGSAANLSLSIDMAAMGDFEASDTFVWEYSFDGGATYLTAFASSVDEAGTLLYTLDSGTSQILSDPMLVGATVLDNDFQTLHTDLTGTGDRLLVRLTAETNGGSEAFAFRAITIEGDQSVETVIATATGSAGDTNLVSFSSDAPPFASPSDAFGILQRGVTPSIPFSLLDDTLSVFPGDSLGIVGEGNLDPFFGIVDTENGDNSGPVTATWVFDIGSATDLSLAIDMAAMGDFEASDIFVWEYSFDSGATFQTVWSSVADEAASLTYTLDSGASFTLDDPMTLAETGGTLTNNFQTLTADLNGTGEELLLRLTAEANGGSEAIAFQNIAVSGVQGGGPRLSIGDAEQIEGTGGSTTFLFTVTLSEPVNETVTVDVNTVDGTAVAGEDYSAVITETLTFDPGETSKTVAVSVVPDASVEEDETFSLVLSNPTNAAIGDGEGLGTILNDDIEITKIHEIQGAVGTGSFSEIGVDDLSPLVGEIVTIQAVVTADFQDGLFGTLGDLNGFFVQEEDADADANPLTSEGIFIFDGSSPSVDVTYGDLVEITGDVSEFNGQTQINLTGISVLANSLPVPTAAAVTFPTATVMIDGAGGLTANLEAYEGMLVNLPQDMTITEMFNLDRFGQYTVNANGQEFQFTQTDAPDVAGYQAHMESVAASTIVLDDGLTQSSPDPIRIIDGGDGVLTSDDSFRMGDQISDITGVLNYSFGEFRIQNGTGTYSPANPRPDGPADTGGNFKIASLNVLNYFTTIDVPGATTDNGSDPRGADSEAEFERQAVKIVNAIVEMDADILGLVELENDFKGTDFAIKDLVERVNAELGGDVYAWVDPGQEFVGDDAIANGIIYKIAEVQPLGDAAILTTFDGRNFLDPLDAGRDLNRAAIAQTFEDLDTGQTMTISVNHLKSKGSLSGVEADNDQLDGQGRNNATRTEAVDILADWLASDPTGQGSENTLIIGDLNAYAMEDPVTALLNSGYKDLSAEASGGTGTPYTYTFDGQVGTLDYILASGPMTENVSGVTQWHINADEADAIDYNLDFGRNPALYDGTSSARNSDHDPVIAGFDLPINYNEIAGTDKRDQIDGTDGRDRIDAMGGPDVVRAGAGDDLIIAGGGPVDKFWGEMGADIFQFSEEIAGNKRKDQAFLLDFDIEEDMIDLGGAQISDYRELNNFVEIKLDGGRDRILVFNTDDFDSIQFVDTLMMA